MRKHKQHWNPPDWSSSNERLPADLAAAKQSVQQEERAKAMLKASTDALAAKAKSACAFSCVLDICTSFPVCACLRLRHLVLPARCLHSLAPAFPASCRVYSVYCSGKSGSSATRFTRFQRRDDVHARPDGTWTHSARGASECSGASSVVLLSRCRLNCGS